MEIFRAGIDPPAQRRRPTRIALVEQFLDTAVGPHRRRDLQAAGKRIHAANVGMEQIDRLKALPPHLGIEIDAAGGQAAIFQDRVHHLGGEVDAGGELIGIPAHQRIAGVGVDRSEEALHAGIFQFVLHLVAGQRGMVGFNVHLHMLLQAVGPEEVDAGGAVEIVLMLGGLTRLRLEVELTGEADFLGVGDRHVHEPGEVIHLPLHVGIPQALVALAAAPECVALAAEGERHFQRLLHLRGGIGKDLRIAAGGGTMHIAGIAEQVGRAPEKLDAGAFLMQFQARGHRIEMAIRLRQCFPFGSHIAVVEAVKPDAEFLHELKRHLHPGQSPFQRVAAGFPGAEHGRRTEGIAAGAAERMPVRHSKPQVVAHRHPLHQFAGIIVAKRQHVFGGRALEADGADLGKCLRTVPRRCRHEKTPQRDKEGG